MYCQTGDSKCRGERRKMSQSSAGSIRVSICEHSFARSYVYRERKRLHRETEGGWMSVVHHQIYPGKDMVGVRRFSPNGLQDNSLLWRSGVCMDVCTRVWSVSE